MFEAVITLVIPGRNFPSVPYTEVYRIEFDTEGAMRDWLTGTHHMGAWDVRGGSSGATNFEKLGATEET